MLIHNSNDSNMKRIHNKRTKRSVFGLDVFKEHPYFDSKKLECIEKIARQNKNFYKDIVGKNGADAASFARIALEKELGFGTHDIKSLMDFYKALDDVRLIYR